MEAERALQPGLGWTPEKVALLRRHFEMGLSASQSGQLLGVTRLAVIGKRSRLGLVEATRAPAEPKPGLPAPKVERRGSFSNPFQVEIKVSDAPLPEIAPTLERLARGGKVIAELGPNDCRFPLQPTGLEADATTLFCAEPVLIGKSYCRCHHAMAYRPTPPPEPTGAISAPDRAVKKHHARGHIIPRRAIAA